MKSLLNSVISTPNAKSMTIDIKYFYLNTPMSRYEYMRLKLSNLPEYFVQQYDLASKRQPTIYQVIYQSTSIEVCT